MERFFAYAQNDRLVERRALRMTAEPRGEPGRRARKREQTKKNHPPAFPTDRLAPFIRYAISFEYIEDNQFAHIASFEGRRPVNFTLRAAVINRPPVKAPHKPKVISMPKEKYRPMSRDIEDPVRIRENRGNRYYNYRNAPARDNNRPENQPGYNQPNERRENSGNRTGSRL